MINARGVRYAISRFVLWLTLGIAGFALPFAVSGAELREPRTLASEHGVLDLLMVARADRLTSLGPNVPVGWVFEICRRPADRSERCPTDPTANYYGGTRLALNPGDTLKVHLVNRLPPALNSKHALDPGEEFLALNPTNLHTHGLMVSPHKPSPGDPTYGDNVFVLTFNPANGTPTLSPHMHSDVRMGATDYTIPIPANHPAGLYWFHPHAHGLSLNQISAGMAGILTVGSVGSYVCADAACTTRADTFPVRHLILKDTQVLADGRMHDQEEPDFCLPASPTTTASLGAGGCPGQDHTADGGDNFTGGTWFFTLNGQVNPTVTVAAPTGEIWRLTNASGSVTYDLNVFDPAANRELVMQVISLDGVSVAPTAGMSSKQYVEIAGQKLTPVRCPGIAPDTTGGRLAEPLCVTRLHMMPSSRAEVWVTYRDRNNRPASPGADATAILRTAGYQTGPDGDTWPAIDLATVRFAAAGERSRAATMPDYLPLRGEAKKLMSPSALSGDLYGTNTAVGYDPACHSLPAGHRRRIYFNVPADNPEAFGLGYEELDERGRPVPGTFQDVAPYDPMRPTVCLPLAAGNSVAKETWELVNLASEDHNFHIHQVHFRIVGSDELAGTRIPHRVLGDGVTMDNVPLAHTDGLCTTVEDWRAGKCSAHPVVVEIPFAIAGDFVYHCHILEHEDGGMMARIRVRPNP